MKRNSPIPVFVELNYIRQLPDQTWSVDYNYNTQQPDIRKLMYTKIS